MAEIVTTTAAVQADPGASVFRIALLVFDWEHARIKVQLDEWNGSAFVVAGKRIVASYDGATATTLMIQLNKANLSTQSLHQRVLARLLADGFIPLGTQSGTPD